MPGALEVGSQVPDAALSFVPWTPEQEDGSACGVKASYNVHEEWKGKKIVLFGVPGAFTPTCQVSHLPAFAQGGDKFKSKGVDLVAVIAGNDAFVMSGWLKANQAGGKIVGLADPDGTWLKPTGLDQPPFMGNFARSKRFAAVIDNLEVKYIGIEEGNGKVSVSGADAVLSHL